MTERMERMLIDQLSEPCPPDFSDLTLWRHWRDRMEVNLRELDKILECADYREMEELQERLNRLQARLRPHGLASDPMHESPTDAKPSSPAKPAKSARPEIDKDGIVAAPSYSETDAGMGTGSREPPMTYEAFTAQLTDLRDRTTEKRARGGLG